MSADHVRSTRSTALREIALVLIASVVAAVIGALVWSRVVDLPRVSRVKGGTSLDEVQLAKFIGVDGWFTVIAVVLGVMLGVVVARRARLDAVASVLAVAAGAMLAGWLMLQVGQVVGPDDPSDTIAGIKVGQSLPVLLRPHAEAVIFAWPIAALVGVLLVLCGPLALRSAGVDRVRATSSSEGSDDVHV